MDKKKDTLVTYVEYVANLNLCKNIRDNLYVEKKNLEEMNSILKRYKALRKDDNISSVSSNPFQPKQAVIQSALDEITRDLGILEQDIANAQGSVEENKDTNVEELDKKINEERDKISQYIDKLKSETLISKDTTNKEALDELAKIKKRSDESVKKITQFKSY